MSEGLEEKEEDDELQGSSISESSEQDVAIAEGNEIQVVVGGEENPFKLFSYVACLLQNSPTPWIGAIAPVSFGDNHDEMSIYSNILKRERASCGLMLASYGLNANLSGDFSDDNWMETYKKIMHSQDGHVTYHREGAPEAEIHVINQVNRLSQALCSKFRDVTWFFAYESGHERFVFGGTHYDARFPLIKFLYFTLKYNNLNAPYFSKMAYNAEIEEFFNYDIPFSFKRFIE